MRKLFRKRWFILLLAIIVIGMIANHLIRPVRPCDWALLQKVYADETGTTIDILIARSEQRIVDCNYKLQGRTLTVMLRTSMWGENTFGETLYIDVPASAYDDLVIRCNGMMVEVPEYR
ncbi:MAG: hypothetical protein IJB81_06450 [Clostridia bacterium]|nr:hypothetical protein [Clostridia bacterium]